MSSGLQVSKPTPRTVASIAERLLLDLGATAAIEFALLAPVVVSLTIGMVNYGALIYQDTQVAVAAHAGADYAFHEGWNPEGIAAAVAAATALPVLAAPSPILYNACIVGGSVVPTDGTTCALGAKPGAYVLVSASYRVTPIIPWPGFLLPAALSSRAMVRLG